MRLRGIELAGHWPRPEVAALHLTLKPLPSRWLEENRFLRRFVRDKVLTDAPPSAPGHSKYDPITGSIVVFDKGVYHGGKIDLEQFRRCIYHELAHTLLRMYPALLRAWMAGTKGDGFVDEYAKTSPEEDFADTFSEFFINVLGTKRKVPRKAQFLTELYEQANEEKTAMPNHFLNAFTDELVKVAIGRAELAMAGVPAAAGAALSGGDRERPLAGRVGGAAGGVAGALGGSHLEGMTGKSKQLTEYLAKHPRAGGLATLALLGGGTLLGSRLGGRLLGGKHDHEKTSGAMSLAGDVGKMGLKALKTPLGKGVAATGIAGAGGLAYGASKGRQKGLAEGSQYMDDGMREAYSSGVQRGAQAMIEQIQQQMQGGES